MRIHAQTAGSQLTSFGVENNYARVTIQALAAVLGGVQSLHTNSFNEALSLPTEKSSKFAINIQHILMEETDLLKAADPLRGSYVIENLTLVLEREVLEIIKSIEKLGGVVDCINLGYQRNLIERNSFIESKSVAENTKKIVGLNTGVVIDETEDNEAFYFRQPTQDKNLFKIEKKAVQLNYEFKSLKEAALGDQNVMYPIKDLILKGATVSQICDVLKECWGVYSA
jgi:methylmalonyl-CoA mutase N-terminal domain/subunit